MRLSIIAVLSAIFAMAACTPMPAVEAPSPGAPAQSADAAACRARGGDLMPVGRMQSIQCVIRYADAGKRCTDGDQCQGDCRAEPSDSLREGATAAGVCQASSNRFGCFTTIENGKAEATLCID